MYVSYCKLLVKCCNIWYVVLNHVRSWLVVSWFEILRDFIGLPELYGLKCGNLITPVIVFLYLCSYNLDSSVTLCPKVLSHFS
jgi:hypothetical protein